MSRLQAVLSGASYRYGSNRRSGAGGQASSSIHRWSKIDLYSRMLFRPEILYLIVSNSTMLSVNSVGLPRDSKEAILAVLDALPRAADGQHYMYLSGPEASIRLVTNGLRVIAIMIEADGEEYFGMDAREELGRFAGTYTVAVSRVSSQIAGWGQEYSVGIRIIDEQHKRFFEIINMIFESMVKGSLDEDGDKLFRSLKDYTEDHFRTEEAIMDKYNYPALDEHRRHHDQFSRVINSYYETYQQGGLEEPGTAVELLNIYRTWLRDHILVADKRYEEYFKKMGIRVDW